MKNKQIIQTNHPKVSVIIPVKAINDYIRESLPYLLKQDYSNYEIIILPDAQSKQNAEIKNKKVRIITSGVVGPAVKRDLGAKKAKGEILAFIDDDAFPEKSWISRAVRHFQTNPSLGAIGGPNLTPKSNTLFQKASGEVLASYLISGPAHIRYKKINHAKECDDMPSCNLFVSKSLFEEIKGFDSSWWPGEDTKLCRDIKVRGKRILCDPDMLVYHHRRKTLSSYLKQIFNYSKHRGHFMRKIPENSLKLSYFIPSLFVLGLLGGFALSFFSFSLKIIYLSVLVIYLALMGIEAIRTRKLAIALLFIPIGFLTHITYGVGLLFGLLKPNLKSQLRK